MENQTHTECLFGHIRNIHFVGIGGIGMSGLAHILLAMGYRVTGSDTGHSATIESLRKQGAVIHDVHRPEHVNDANVVVFSSAIATGNPELKRARERNISLIHRSEMLAEISRMKYAVLVSGTHGKTTTTSLVAHLLQKAKFDPMVVIGGRFNNIDSTATLGKGTFMVGEADESDGSFLLLTPTIAICTNVDLDHMDHYRDRDHLLEAFATFVNKVPFYGCIVLNLDDPGVQDLLPMLRRPVITIGTSSGADFRFEVTQQIETKTSFHLFEKNDDCGLFEVPLPGRYNVFNTVCAIAASRFLDVPMPAIRGALADYKGVEHRFSVIGEKKGIVLVDDYAHNPAKIRSALEAARKGWSRRIVAVFQPHRYSRVAFARSDFGKSFYDADIVFITPIYSAGETPIPGADQESLATEIRAHGHRDVRIAVTLDDLPTQLLNELKENDLLITLGAGNVWQICHHVRDAL